MLYTERFKKIRQNQDAICQKQKTLQNSILNPSVVLTFKFYFMLCKFSMWPPPAARTPSSRYENSSQMRQSMTWCTMLCLKTRSMDPFPLKETLFQDQPISKRPNTGYLLIFYKQI